MTDSDVQAGIDEPTGRHRAPVPESVIEDDAPHPLAGVIYGETDDEGEEVVIEPDDSLAYIGQRLMDIEVAIYRAPVQLAKARDAEKIAQDAYDEARAHALARVKAGAKLTVPEAEARVFLQTKAERRALAVAAARYEYAKDVSRSLDREKDALQTRSANLRAQITLAGRGGA
ncbi:hypothetical protein SEA_DARDANUS_45 [Gordonia phage Dardanus]|uniref:Uncharacterized protein n=1 Tax=Gordonia phage Dardanus TaxID=2588489 RepID=A0A514CX38_9CAUD|nr:hypothetical protein KDJ58_gp45 [Gordonia phage Dardanus]QDH85082.1 hypothetical protein SEA_DARDANUS_45 [Gordonia phage Dardanus]